MKTKYSTTALTSHIKILFHLNAVWSFRSAVAIMGTGAFYPRMATRGHQEQTFLALIQHSTIRSTPSPGTLPSLPFTLWRVRGLERGSFQPHRGQGTSEMVGPYFSFGPLHLPSPLTWDTEAQRGAGLPKETASTGHDQDTHTLSPHLLVLCGKAYGWGRGGTGRGRSRMRGWKRR